MRAASSESICRAAPWSRGRNCFSSVRIGTRAAWALALMAATTLRELSLMGTAIERTPASSSWSTAVQPRLRASASTARSSPSSVMVCSVSLRIVVRRRYASSSGSGRWASRMRPMDVGYGGSRVPTVSAMVMIRFAEARAT